MCGSYRLYRERSNTGQRCASCPRQDVARPRTDAMSRGQWGIGLWCGVQAARRAHRILAGAVGQPDRFSDVQIRRGCRQATAAMGYRRPFGAAGGAASMPPPRAGQNRLLLARSRHAHTTGAASAPGPPRGLPRKVHSLFSYSQSGTSMLTITTAMCYCFVSAVALDCGDSTAIASSLVSLCLVSAWFAAGNLQLS